MRAARRDAAVVEDDDLVGERDRREAVGDDDRRPAAHRLAQAVADLRLGRRVDRRGRVVEDQDARVDDERARDRDALALAARERDPALADHGVVALRQPLDELVRLREPRRALDLARRSRRAGRTRCSRARSPRRGTDPARSRRSRAAATSSVTLAHVGAVDRDAAAPARRRSAGSSAASVVLPAAGVPDQRDDPAGLELEVDARRSTGRVGS